METDDVKARDNRKLRKKRDKREVLRMAHARFDAGILAKRGLTAEQATVTIRPRMMLVDGQREFNLYKTRFAVEINEGYRRLLAAVASVGNGVQSEDRLAS